MSELYNQSFCTTMDLLARNMGLALSIAQRGPHPASNVKAAQKISMNFARIVEHVTESYSQVSETSLQTGFSLPALDPVKKTKHVVDDVIENAIARAMDFNVDSDSEVSGGVAFRKNRRKVVFGSDEEEEDDELADSQFGDLDEDAPFDRTSDEDDTSVDIDSMLPGQRENHLRTKALAQGLRMAAFHDTNNTKTQKETLGIKTN
jgi:hypothetical protein